MLIFVPLTVAGVITAIVYYKLRVKKSEVTPIAIEVEPVPQESLVTEIIKDT